MTKYIIRDKKPDDVLTGRKFKIIPSSSYRLPGARPRSGYSRFAGLGSLKSGKRRGIL